MWKNVLAGYVGHRWLRMQRCLANSSLSHLACIQPSACGNFKTFFLFTCRRDSAGNKRTERHRTSHEEHVKWLDKVECVDQQEQQQLRGAAIWQHYHRERVCTFSQGTQAWHLISRSQPPMQIRGKQWSRKSFLVWQFCIGLCFPNPGSRKRISWDAGEAQSIDWGEGKTPKQPSGSRVGTREILALCRSLWTLVYVSMLPFFFSH